MLNPNYSEFLRDVVNTVHANIGELKERKNFADPEELTHIEAKLLAYHEILHTLKSGAEEFGIPGSEIGL